MGKKKDEKPSRKERKEIEETEKKIDDLNKAKDMDANERLRRLIWGDK